MEVSINQYMGEWYPRRRNFLPFMAILILGKKNTERASKLSN